MSELNDPDLNRFYHPLIKTLAKMMIFCPSTGFPTFHMNQLRKIRRHQIIIKLAKSESDTLWLCEIITGSTTLRKFTDVCMVRDKSVPPPQSPNKGLYNDATLKLSNLAIFLIWGRSFQNSRQIFPKFSRQKLTKIELWKGLLDWGLSQNDRFSLIPSK